VGQLADTEAARGKDEEHSDHTQQPKKHIDATEVSPRASDPVTL
jgi:hypothetical protein